MKLNVRIWLIAAIILIFSLLESKNDLYAQNFNSATDSVVVTSTNSVVSWGRGFRFSPTQDIWVMKIGKRVPSSGSYSWVIWDFATQTKVYEQTSQLNTPGQYVYEDLDSVIKLNSGTQYILELYGAGTAEYYYGNSSQIGQHLTYYDMRFCNSCTNNTFPTTILTNYHYGTPDFLYVLSYNCDGTPVPGTAQAASTSIPCNTTTTLSLSGNTAGLGITYQWQYNNGSGWTNFGVDEPSPTTPPITQTTQFRCILTCTNPGGGTDTSTAISVNTTETAIEIISDTFLCPGQSLTLSTNATGQGNTYQWSNNQTTPNITITSSGVYSVEVTYLSGCTSKDTLTIHPGTNPQNNLSPILNLCDGDTAILDAGNPGSTYIWGMGQTTQTITTADSGVFTVTIENYMGCQISTSTEVIKRPIPTVDLLPNPNFCEGQTMILDAQNPGSSFLWNTSDTTQQINITDPGLYSVTITSPYGCIGNESVQISQLPAPKVGGFNFVPLFYETLGKVQFFPESPIDVDQYEWDFGDASPLSTDQNPIHYYSSTGDYIVSLTVTNYCGSFTVSLPLHIDLTTGIITPLAKDQASINIYPNPASNILLIKNNHPELEIVDLRIYDLLGRKVYQAKDPKSEKVSVQNLSSGIYTIMITTENQKVITKKFEIRR